MTEGVKGGDVNRPGSSKEIRKDARTVCRKCHMGGPWPIVVAGACSNAIACAKRVKKWERENPPAPAPPPAKAAKK